MKKLGMLLVLTLSVWMSGCTLTESVHERHQRILAGTELNLKMAVEDCDYIWFTERNSYLTQWHPHVGF